MRNIDFIVIHCTATSQDTKIESIKKYWQTVLGWKNYGYHFIIDKNGNTLQLTDINKIANGVKNYNHNSIHISYVGGINILGIPTDTRTDQQKKSILSKIIELKKIFPHAKIQGHKDFPNVKKACPSFNAKLEYSKY
jgi:N-acetylmuramoyl-L-alanine amidase